MTKSTIKNRTLGTALAVALAAVSAPAFTGTAHAQGLAAKPANDLVVAVGAGRMVRLNGTMSDLFVANDTIADVQVRSANQLYIFGKSAGETTVYATNKAGKVVYSANVRVGANFDSIGGLLGTAMPDARIQATPMNGVVLLTGTVGAPEDIEEAGRIVQAYVGSETKIISRLKTATPAQVMLKVTFAEVSRSVAKQIGVNLMTHDPTSGFQFGVVRSVIPSATDPVTGLPINAFERIADGKTAVEFAGNLFGLNVASTLSLDETDGRVVVLAEPTLTALSGETASFLAGGEFPIPIAQTFGTVSIEYKSYGVGLAFTPTVLADGRISMRVRPEVSELSDQGAIKMNNFDVPSLTMRRAETTVELGSGQSFVIGGLLRNTGNNSTTKAPWLGDLPILGALFRSNSFKRQETELVIVVTPYLVRPVNASEIALPTDGLRNANDAQRILLDRQTDSRSGEQRPGPVMAPPREIAPGLAPAAAATPMPARHPGVGKASVVGTADASAAPGFDF